MKLRAILVAVAALLSPAFAHAQASDCAPEGEIMLLQDFAVFDQSPRGWRGVAARPGCEAAAADLIARFRTFQKDWLAPEEAGLLSWHEGQVRARLGDTAKALAVMETARTPDAADPFNDYLDATLAFLKKDRAKLAAAHASLAARPKPADFDAMADAYAQQTGRTPRWPPNLDAVDALTRCFDRTYREALSDPACRG